ncbi:MAG TPA: rubrerythrin family protein [Terracidiphilus sp.]|nr:rubrerythrin family protein [Terracidiphilus sp.]
MATDRMIAHVVGVEDLTVIRNLETAFEEETKTSTSYKAYAARADEEGFPGLASLFRATALAEQIHAGNHARVLRHMGGTPAIDAPKLRIDGTLENLKTALVDQKFEVDYLYPAFLTTAVPLFDSTAIRSFHWALEADKSHVRLYEDVIARVQTGGTPGWEYEKHAFFVCGLCGYAAEHPEGENCPGCNYLWEKFEAIM